MSRPVFLAVAASLFVALPCAAQPAPAPQPTTSLAGAPVGTEVTVAMSTGLAPGARVSVGFGGMSGGYELVARAEADASGAFSISVPVPSWAEPNLVYYFFVNLGGGVRTLSDPFLVTSPQGALEITGTVSAAAPGCVLIAGGDQIPYALFGVTDAVVSGMRVRVEGTLGPEEEAGPVGSRCGRPAIPVRVRSLRAG